MAHFITGIIVLATLTQACGFTLAEQPVSCQDFLQQWGAKPKELKFSDCKKIKGKQSDELVASYVVSGKNAKKVERVLIASFKMPPLRFQCCGWVSTVEQGSSNLNSRGFYKDKDGQQYYIQMASEETIIKEWNRIPVFNVRVGTYLGEI